MIQVSPRIATNTTVSRDELLDFIRPRHQAIVITQRTGGRPQASPVTCGVDAAGRIVVSTYPERAKTHNARNKVPGSACWCCPRTLAAPGCRWTATPK